MFYNEVGRFTMFYSLKTRPISDDNFFINYSFPHKLSKSIESVILKFPSILFNSSMSPFFLGTTFCRYISTLLTKLLIPGLSRILVLIRRVSVFLRTLSFIKWHEVEPSKVFISTSILSPFAKSKYLKFGLFCLKVVCRNWYNSALEYLILHIAIIRK